MIYKAGQNFQVPVFSPSTVRVPVAPPTAEKTAAPLADSVEFAPAPAAPVVAPPPAPTEEMAAPATLPPPPQVKAEAPPRAPVSICLFSDGSEDAGIILGGTPASFVSNVTTNLEPAPSSLDKPYWSLADQGVLAGSGLATLTPKYINDIQFLNDRYAGVTDKLAQSETDALKMGYDEVSAMGLHSKLMQNPPWPSGSTPDMRAKITAKAKELAAQNPEMSCTTGDQYDFSKAQAKVENVYSDLLDLLPKEQYPDAKIAARAKAPDSLKTKVSGRNQGDSKDFTVGHLTDTVGARIDVGSLADLGSAAKKLEAHYGDKIVGRLDYMSDPGANGYRALHYIVDLGDRMAEIQVSTNQLRAADLATHDTIYKPLVPISNEAAEQLRTAADRIMFVETMKYFGAS